MNSIPKHYLILIAVVVACISSCSFRQDYENYEPVQEHGKRIVDTYYALIKANKYSEIKSIYYKTGAELNEDPFLEFNSNYVKKAGELIDYEFDEIISKITVINGDTTGFVKISTTARHSNFDIEEEFTLKYFDNKLKLFNLTLFQSKLFENTDTLELSDSTRLDTTFDAP